MITDAMNKITVKMLKNLKHGEEIALNNEYTLYFNFLLFFIVFIIN